MKNIQSFIFTLLLAFMAVAILPACSSTDEQPSTTEASEPPPPSGTSDDCVVDDHTPLRPECLKE